MMKIISLIFIFQIHLTFGVSSSGKQTYFKLSPSVSSFSVRCPRSSDIYPCDCLELEKGSGNEFENSDSLNDTLSDDYYSEEVHPDIIETVVFCKHIYHKTILMNALKSFKGYRINYLVLDSCELPPFPTNIFSQINVQWMEIVNSTIQFRETFFECGGSCL